MGNLIVESFGHVTRTGAGGLYPDLTAKWSYAFDLNVGLAYGRLGRAGCNFYADAQLNLVLAGTGGANGLAAGFVVNFQGGNSNAFCAVFDPAGAQVSFVYNSSNQLVVYDTHGTAVITTNAMPFLNTFYYLEFKITPDPTGAGVITVWVDGVQVGTSTTAFTTSGTWTTFQKIGWFGVGRSYSIYVGEIYINDLTGAHNNGQNGDSSVLVSFPNGAGASTNFTIAGSSPAATNWQGVNEVQPDYDVTENSSSNPGDIDLFTMTVPSGLVVVSAVQVCIYVRKNDSASRVIAPVMYQGGTTFVGTAFELSVPSSFVYLRWTLNINPITGVAWTVSDISTSQFGYKVIS
jgi:hypothetical protein